MIRSNPGLILLKEGVILNKWGVNELPDEYQLSDRLEMLPISKVDVFSSAFKVFMLIVSFVVILFVICMFDLYWEKRRLRKVCLEQADEMNDN